MRLIDRNIKEWIDESGMLEKMLEKKLEKRLAKATKEASNKAKLEGKMEMITEMLQNGLDIEIISKYSNLSKEEIEKLISENKVK